MSTTKDAERIANLKSDQEIVDRANHIAGEFYRRMGCFTPEGYRFDQATHPQERLCWQLARVAFEELLYTDIGDALINIEDYEPSHA